jgi:dihydroflavonol-4-reductase
MRVMVTGATGFTGGHLARTLRSRGHEVHALVRDAAKAQALQRDGIHLHVGDITDAESVRKAAAGCELVYHLAAVYREARHPSEYYSRVNVEGTCNVLDAVVREGVGRLVHCSTVGVHGDVLSIPGSEDSPFAPGDIYQSTKLEGELLVRARIDAGLCGTIFRPQGIYGPGDTRFLKLFNSVSNGTFRMIGSGETYYHMTYISDLVDGIILCGEHPAAVGQTYILGGPNFMRLREIVATLGDVIGKSIRRGHVPVAPVMAAAIACEWICAQLKIEPPLYPRRLDFFIKDRAFSIEKAQRDLGYQPKIDLAEGLRRTYEWYRQAGWL